MSAPWLALALAGCAMRGTLRYEPLAEPLPEPTPDFVRQLPAVLANDLDTGRIPGVSAPALGGAVPPDRLSELPEEVQYALFGYALPWTRGAELDALVDLGSGPRPVSLRVDLDRAVEVTWGDAPPPPPVADAPRPDLGLAGIRDGDASWTAAELTRVHQALARLDEATTEALRGLVLVRGSASPRAARREYAFYDPRRHPPELWFFDKAFEQEAWAFTGDPEAPNPAACLTILHEVGHALADLPARDAFLLYRRAEDAWLADPTPETRAARREGWRAVRRAQRTAPVVTAWHALRSGRRGPSSFGFRDPHESFAEAFALAHCDRGALERALPGAVAWFESGAHLEAAGLGPRAMLAP